MKNEDKEINDIVEEVNELKQSEALNKVLLKLLKDNKQENMRLWLLSLFLILFAVFIIVFLQFASISQQDKFIAEQEKYLKFLKEFDYEVEIVEEGYDNGLEDIEINQDNTNGNNVVQTGNNATYNQ